jgi:putative endonuclease
MIISITEPKISIEKTHLENWYVYIVECSDKSFYTGVTNNIKKRIEAHNSGKGAKYTRARKPVTLRYLESDLEKRYAFKREYQIKQLSKKQKELLILTQNKN